MRHLLHIPLRFVAGLVAGLAVIAGFGIFILAQGPMSLDTVAPFVASLLSRGTGVAVAIDHTALSVARGRLVVLARGVHLQRKTGGGTALTLGDVAIEFNPRTLLSGVIAPTQIVVNRPELRLDRAADGSLRIGIGEEESGAGGENWGPILVGALVRPPDGVGALGYLTEITLQNASLTVEDRALGLEWHAADAEASLIRSTDRSRGNFRIIAGQDQGDARLSGDFTYLPGFGQLVVRIGFNDLRLAPWAEASPDVAGFAVLDAPLSGELRGEFDPERLTLRDAIADVSLGQGALRHRVFEGGALEIAGAKLEGGYDAQAGRFNLGRFAIDLGGGASASIAGEIDGLGADLLTGGWPQAFDIALDIGARGLKLEDFPRLWPERLAVSTRSWVTQHIRTGMVEGLAAKLALHVALPGEAPAQARLKSFSGTMQYSNLAVEYFRPLPPATGVTGTAQFDGTQIEFKASSGDVGKIHAPATTARFYKLDTNDEQAKIVVDAQGPLADALALLDTPPLYYAREIGLDPKRAAGSFTARLDFAFPLINALALKDVDYGATAQLSDVAAGEIMFHRDLSNGALSLTLDRNAAQIDGTAALGGVPIALSWRESLQAKAAIRAHYTVKAVLDDAQRRDLGLDFVADAVKGKIGVAASYDLAADKRNHAAIALDLTQAAIEVKQISWKKEAGVPAAAQLMLDLADDKVTALREATLLGGGIDAKAALDFDDKGISAVSIDHVIDEKSDFRGRIARDGAAGWRIALAGKSFDASGLADQFDHAPPSDAPEPPLAIELALDRLLLGPDRQARAVTASLASDGIHWQTAAIAARLGDKAVKLSYDGSAPSRPFNLTSEDFGALLKLLGIYDDIEGGNFTLAGQVEDRQGKRVLVAKADGGDYRVVRAPTLARLLSIASLSGINALLTGQGIPFNRLQGDVEIETGAIGLKNMRAYGGAIGINASGTIDRIGRQLNVSGTLVPAYTLNSILGNIPVLGDLILGGEGQGVFASNFRIYGAMESPQVSVNALSTLAPGFLRNLFLFSPGGPSQ